MIGKTNVKVKPKSKIQYVSYIRGKGGQWIDTEYKPSNKTNIILDYEYIAGTETYTPIAVQRNSSSTANMFGFWVNETSKKVAIIYGTTDTGDIANTNAVGRHVYRNEGGNFYIDDVLVKTITANAFTCEGTLPIFAFKQADTLGGTRQSNGKLYGLKIYENNVLLKDYRPVKDGEGKYCLYEEIEGKYYYHQGTGELGGDGYIEPIPEATGLLMDFDDNLVDKTGLTEPKLISNTATFVDGKFGKAIYLPSEEYVSIPLTTETTLGTGDFTVAGWFNIEDTSQSRCLWSFAYEASSSAYWQGVQIWYNSQFNFCCDLSASSKNRKSTTAKMTPNVWYHIAMVRYNNTVTVYVNGKSIGTLSANGTVYQNAKNDWKIGASSSTSSYPIRETFKGKVDDFIIVKKALWTSNFVPPTLPYGGVEK